MVAMKSFQFMKNRTQRQQLAQPESKSAREKEGGKVWEWQGALRSQSSSWMSTYDVGAELTGVAQFSTSFN